MSAVATTLQEVSRGARCPVVTLLELVEAVNDVSESEQEVVTTVQYMLRTGSVKLGGCFRGESIDAFLA